MKRVSGTNYKQREIVLVPFPYSDLSSSKRRPVLIVSTNDYNKNFQDVLVCVITSNLHKDAYSVELESSDLEIGVLPESSVVKAHKLFTIHQRKILKKFSLVKDDFFEKVVDEIRHLVEP
ncbi:MAG: type II toxin-antitoxin system PemK/MazF family toxin [Acidobacteria bacterium]|nr:type II toxin-antitoxin system PemK/MazF family toxin [Acidobacteriota bacterium]